MIKGEFDFTKKLIRENLNEQLNAFQDILTPTLLFDDSIAAKEIIDSFSYNPQIEGAVLWREDESSNSKRFREIGFCNGELDQFLDLKIKQFSDRKTRNQAKVDETTQNFVILSKN